MNKNNHISFKIKITNNYKIQCSIINEEKEIIIKLLSEDLNEEYSSCVSFENNKISICKETNNSIYFLKEWIENPDNYSTKQIFFQNNEYNLLPEVMFSLIINDFKKIIEKEYIIDETIVEISSRDHVLLERIKISIEAIGLNNIQINPLSYDYLEQGKQLFDLIQRKERDEKYFQLIQQAEKINHST